jgi:hypothetical protein
MMFVEDVIKTLQENYKPTDELFIEWWDADLFRDDNGEPIESMVWSKAIHLVEQNPSPIIGEVVHDQIEDAIYAVWKGV